MANTALDTIDITTNTFKNWVDKTNEAITVLTKQAVTVTNTVNGDTVSGNGSVNGTLSANVLATVTLRGGSVNSTANLSIISNTNISAAYVNVVANTLIYSNSTIAAAVFGGNSVATNTTLNSTYLNINSNVAVVGTSHTLSGNVNVDTGTLFVDSAANRIGINTVSPNTELTVNGSVYLTGSVTHTLMKLTANSVTTSGLTQVVIDTFPTNAYRGGKYTVSVTDQVSATSFQTSEILIMQDGTSAYVTEYAVLRNGSSLGTFAADISSGNTRLLFTPAVSNSNIKFARTLVSI